MTKILKLLGVINLVFFLYLMHQLTTYGMADGLSWYTFAILNVYYMIRTITIKTRN